MATGRDDEDGRYRKTLRVASRAVRRGRTLRPSMLPPAPSDGRATESSNDEPPHAPRDALVGEEDAPQPALEAPCDAGSERGFGSERFEEEDEEAGSEGGCFEEEDEEAGSESERSEEEDEQAGSESERFEYEEDARPQNPDSRRGLESEREPKAVAATPSETPERAPEAGDLGQGASEPTAVASDAPPFGGPSIRVHESLLPDDGPASTRVSGPSIRVHESTFPDDGPASTRSSGPSIRVHDSLLPDEFDDEEMAKSARFSRPPAPSLTFGGKRKAPTERTIPTPTASRPVLEIVPDVDEAPPAEAPALRSSEQVDARSPKLEQAAEATETHAAAAPSATTVAATPSDSRRGAPDDDELFFAPGASGEGSRRGLWIGLALGAVGLAVLFTRSPPPEPKKSPEARPIVVVTTKASTAQAAGSAAPPVAPSAVAADASPTPSASATSTESAAQPDGGSAADGSDFDSLRKRFVGLHNRKDLIEAEAVARQLIELRPHDATAYLCLGAALQDQGRVKEAKRVFSECVTEASRGDVAECAQLGGTLQSPKR